MATMTIRNLPDDVHHALKVRAAMNNRSAEAEVRDILTAAATGTGPISLGEVVLAFGRQVGLTDEEHALFERDKSAPGERTFN